MWLDNTIFRDHLGMWDAIINLYVYAYISTGLIISLYISVSVHKFLAKILTEWHTKVLRAGLVLGVDL